MSAETSDHKTINAYYAQWTVYSGFTVKTIDTSGTAKHLDILSYAFVNIGTNAKGQYECTSFDSWADNGIGYAATAYTSVDGKGQEDEKLISHVLVHRSQVSSSHGKVGQRNRTAATWLMTVPTPSFLSSSKWT